MAKFRKKSNTSQEIPTSALPDIIFMLLFFFMVTTVVRDSEIKLEQRIPNATQISKLEKKSLVKYIYMGKPRQSFKSILGTEPKIQVNDVIIETKKIIQWVNQEKDKMPMSDRDKITIALKVDKEAKMGLVSDVQQELRKANALKIVYTSYPKGSGS